MNPKYLQDIIKNLQEFYKCPSCRTGYSLNDIKILGQIDLFYFVQLSCHKCSMSVLATASVEYKNKMNDKTVNNISFIEKDKFAKMGNITPEEIATFYQFISKYRGRYNRL